MCSSICYNQASSEVTPIMILPTRKQTHIFTLFTTVKPKGKIQKDIFDIYLG